MSKRPSFQFYPNDWLSCEKVAMMTPAEEGAYIRLLCFCWKSEDCSIPDDDEKLAVLSRMGEGWFKGGSTVVRACFIPFPSKAGFLTHKRLLEERKKQDEWRRKSAEGGRKSAASRKAGELKGGSKMVATKSQPKGNTSSSSSSSKIKNMPPENSGAQVEIPEALKTDAFMAAWSEWLEYRREKRKPCTPMQQQKLLVKLEQFGEKWAIDRMAQAIASGWQGLIFSDDKQEPEKKRGVQL